MIPFIDLNAQQKLIRDKIVKRIEKVLDNWQYILGPEVKELEEKLEEKNTELDKVKKEL